jgi:F-type H+-transporting ATPase subunit delta
MAESVRHATVLDTAEQQLATNYAKALLGAALKTDGADRVLEEFDALLSDVLNELPQLETILAAPRVPVEDKLSMLDRGMGGKVSKTMLNFLKVVCRHRRFGSIRVIHQMTHKLFNEITGRVAVEVRTATPLDGDQLGHVAERLEQVLGKKVVVSVVVDQRLIGGIEVRVGDTVYDGSVAGRLRSLRKTAVDRTTQIVKQSMERFEDAH